MQLRLWAMPSLVGWVHRRLGKYVDITPINPFPMISTLTGMVALRRKDRGYAERDPN